MIIAIGCLANALNISKKVNADDDHNDLEDDVTFTNISQEKVDIPWNRKEQLYWALGALASFIIFLVR